MEKSDNSKEHTEHRSCGNDAEIAGLLAAAKNGNADAMFELGQMYFYGDGIQEDPESAEELWRLAAGNGHAVAARCLRSHFPTRQGN